MTTKENEIEQKLIQKLQELKYTYRPDIRDKAALVENFRRKFESLNRVHLTDAEFARLRDEIITADVFAAAQTLREKGKFTREDGTPLEYTLVNIRDWCKNEFEVINQLRINTNNSHHRYDVILLLNGLPLVQIELKALQVSPRKAMEQIVDYKNDPGNGYTNTLLCFMQLFIVSNESDTRYFANNRNQHFSFNAEERFLPIYQLADKDNNKIAHLHDFADDFLEKCALGQLLSRYMVLVQSEQQILVMRPYGFPEVLQGQNKGNYPFCKVSDISRAVAENGGLLDEATNYVGDDDLLKLKAKLIPKGATVFAKIGEALRLNRRAYVRKECLIDNNATGLKAIEGEADDYFVYLMSQLIDLNKHCGGAVPSVNKSTLEEIEVVVPDPDEQKRIADSLKSLDNLITTQIQKLDALKAHKKGLLQQLFPARELSNI